MIPTKLDNALIGAAGVHFVVSELSLRGLIALPTIRNTAGVDVMVARLDGSRHANLQIKTSQNRVNFWPIGSGFRGWSGENLYYVFVRYLRTEGRLEAFLEPAAQVIVAVEAEIEAGRARGNKDWAPCWFLPKDADGLQRVRQQWLDFDLLAPL